MVIMEFLKVYTILIIPIFILYIAGIALSGWNFGFLGLILVFVINVIPTKLVILTCERVGSISAKLYTGYNGRTKREQYSGYVTQARYFKSKKQYEKALDLIERYLEKDVNYAEALYLKAQILLEGFNDQPAAKQCVGQIINGKAVESDCWYRWAKSMQDELNKGTKQMV